MTNQLRARLRALAGACVLALLLTFAPTARGDDADEADLHFQVGGERYDAGDFRGALEHFLASNRLAPNRNVLFNIARCYEQLKQTPDAYRYYLQAAEGEKDPAVRKRVDDALARIAPNVAQLKVVTDPPGATIYIDRKDLGARGTAPRTFGLAAGKRKILAELPGWDPAESDAVELKLGQTTTVELKLKRVVGTLQVEGTPSGAEVRVDSETGPVVCTLPCSAPVPPGRHVVFFAKDGFKHGETLVEVQANQTAIARSRLEPETGSLVVSADLREALITIDDRPSGFTPAVLNVPVGTHKLRVSVPGFRSVDRTVVVGVGKETKVDVELSALEQVSAASRYEESIEDAPASVTIIAKEELRAMGYPTIAEALRGIRGMYLSDDRSYVTAGVRGFSRPGDYGNRVLVTVDGHPTNDNYIWSSYIGFDGRVDLEDVDRIEVIRGPGSVVYGTSAFFGVINIVTRDKSQPTHGEVGVSTAENGVGRVRGAAVVRINEEAGFWVSAAGAHGMGKDHYYPEYVSNPSDPNGRVDIDAYGRPSDGWARDVDSFDAGTLQARGWWKSLTVQGFLHSRKKRLPTAEYETTFNDNRLTFHDTRGFVEARFEPQVSKAVQLLTRGHVNVYNFDGVLPYTAVDGGPERDVFRGTWAGLEQRVVLTPTDKLRFTVGGELIQHFLTTQRVENDDGPILTDDQGNPGRNDPFTSVAGYALADITAHKRFKISAGARLDYFSSLDNFEFLPAFSPRLAFIVKPYDKGNLKIMGGKAFRAPSVYELYYVSTSQIRPVGIQPEQIYSGELEFTHRFDKSWSGIAAGYANYVVDLIELQTTATGEEQYRNSAAPVLVGGGELEVRREWKGGVMLSLMGSLQKASYLNDPTLREVPNSPIMLGSVKAATPIIGRTLMAMTRLTVETGRPDRNYRDGDAPQAYTDPGVVWDLVLSGEIERTGLRYNLGMYNLMDWKYDTVPSGEFRQRTIVQNGRTVLASLQLSF